MRGLEAGLATFCVYVMLQNGLFHFITITKRATVLIASWIGLLPVYAGAYALMPDDATLWPAPFVAPSEALTAFCGGLFYVFLVMGYIFFFYLAESSVGVRTMIELASRPERGLSLDELTNRYSYEWMLQRRLRRLVHAGYLVEEDGWYQTTNRGHLAASFSAWVKGFLHLGPGG